MFKKVLFAVLVVVLFGGSALAFAWWDNLETDETVTIGVGQGVTLEVVLGTNDGTNVLVPAGVVAQPGQISAYVLTYTVDLDVLVDDILNLTVTATDILIGGNDTNAGLVNVTITQTSATIQNNTVTVTVTVTLTEPSTQAIYELIKNSSITFNLNFLAE